jgi:hypothetical protein
LEQADTVCIKLNELIKSGAVHHDRILYKFLCDTVHSLTDPNNRYDENVIHFYNSIEYLGGESVVNFIRGPMYDGTGKGGIKSVQDARPNFGGLP